MPANRPTSVVRALQVAAGADAQPDGWARRPSSAREHPKVGTRTQGGAASLNSLINKQLHTLHTFFLLAVYYNSPTILYMIFRPLLQGRYKIVSIQGS